MAALGVVLCQWDPPDLVAARAWYEAAAAAGHVGAMFNLGVLFANQWNPPDLPAARAWYEKAAAGGDSAAMNNLGFLLATDWVHRICPQR